MEFLQFDTPYGAMALSAQDGALTRLYLPGEPTPRIVSRETPLLRTARLQLFEYFGRLRQCFDLPLCPEGTDFQKSVWNALCAIPYGQTRSYAQIAQMIGNPNAVRAVGQANSKNPLPIFIPCHRVIAADGSLGGYSAGLILKQTLLFLEQGKNRSEA